MPISIIEYKETVLEMFNYLTEFEIEASLKTAKDRPEFSRYAEIHISAVKQCREILKIILEEGITP